MASSYNPEGYHTGAYPRTLYPLSESASCDALSWATAESIIYHCAAISNSGLPSGSATELPQDLTEQIRRLEELFTVPTERLKIITDRFQNELTRGKLTSCPSYKARRAPPFIPANRETRFDGGGWHHCKPFQEGNHVDSA